MVKMCMVTIISQWSIWKVHSCYVDDNDGHFNFKSAMILSNLRCKVDNCDDQDDPAFDQPWLNFTLPPGKIIIVNNYCHSNCYKIIITIIVTIIGIKVIFL